MLAVLGAFSKSHLGHVELQTAWTALEGSVNAGGTANVTFTLPLLPRLMSSLLPQTLCQLRVAHKRHKVLICENEGSPCLPAYSAACFCCLPMQSATVGHTHTL